MREAPKIRPEDINLATNLQVVFGPGSFTTHKLKAHTTRLQVRDEAPSANELQEPEMDKALLCLMRAPTGSPPTHVSKEEFVKHLFPKSDSPLPSLLQVGAPLGLARGRAWCGFGIAQRPGLRFFFDACPTPFRAPRVKRHLRVPSTPTTSARRLHSWRLIWRRIKPS